MERVISAEMRSSLERNRSMLNSLFEYHRSVNREPDHEDLLSLFLRMASPVYDRGPGMSDELFCSLFGTALTLTGKGFLGRDGRFRNLEEMLLRILDSYHLLLANYENFALHVFNALFNVNLKGGGAVQGWCDRMVMLAGDDMNKFMRNGFITAWRCGLARYRGEAMNMLDSLTCDEAGKIFNTEKISDAEMKAIISSIKKDPWFAPGSVQGQGGPVYLHAGGFSGYGGEFISLPYVFTRGGDLFATDRNSIFRIYPDVFGVELVQENEVRPEGELFARVGTVYGRNREIIHRGRSYPLPDFCDGDIRSAASCGSTVAWTMQNSYRIYIAGISSGE